MKISLAGPAYTAKSVVAAAQETINWYPETIAVGDEPRRQTLVGRPGLKFFAQLTPAKIRCLWAGGGRLFAIHGNKQSEINQAAGITTAAQTVAESSPAASPDPAQIFSNGHQLMIVAGGLVYCNNGAGPEQVFFQLTGTGDTLPTGTGHTFENVLYLDTGTLFTAVMMGGPITIAGRKHTVVLFIDSTHVTIDPPSPIVGGDPVETRWTFTGVGYPGGVNTLSRDPGPMEFAADMVGKVITANGRNYTVTAFTDVDHLAITPAAPYEADVRWNIQGDEPVTAVTGGFLDGYFVVNRPPNPPAPVARAGTRRRNRAGVEEDPGRQFNISALQDGTLWDPLDFGVKEGHGDYIRSILCDHEELWLLGNETTEIWSNVGDPLFPFQRIPGAFIHEGSVSTYAPCSVGTTVCALTGSPNGQTVAYQAVGFQPQRVSTFAQEQAWNAPGFNARDAVSYSYLDAGHLFWVINFWAQQQTWVYDVTEKLWHQRYAYSAPLAKYVRYQPWFHVFIPEWGVGGKHIVGDPATGKLYEQSLDFYDDDDNVIQYIRTFPHLLDEDRNLFHHRFELFLETGTVVAPAPEMIVGLDWSNDRGHTFPANRTVLQTSGVAGKFNKRIVWRRLGSSRDRVYRIGVQGKGKVALTDAFLEVTPSGIA